jgi:hypothetical protein
MKKMVKSSIHNLTRPLARRPPYREPRKRVLIFCEGTVTEPQYFDDFRRHEHNPLVDVVIDEGGVSPKTLVERAAQKKKTAEKEAERFRDEHLKYDEVWCVYDVDAHPKLADAFQQARDNEIKLAVSNPCFELWLLLHFSDQTAHIERDKVRFMLRKHLPGYKKRVDFEKLKSRYTDAVKRANLLKKRCQENGDEGANPSTGVHKLTERIVALSIEARKRR